jgi:two-component system, chemotaxis family, response regulator Rcp1
MDTRRFETNTSTGFEVLIVENDPAASRLTQEAFREVGLTKGVRCVRDGDEALALLRRQGEHADHPLPDIIFLDLHLPRKSGLEVLREIKNSDRLKVTPVVVVSGSDNPAEVREAYELHASCYIRKPNDLHQFLRFIAICYEFWGAVVTLPPKFDSKFNLADHRAEGAR